MELFESDNLSEGCCGCAGANGISSSNGSAASAAHAAALVAAALTKVKKTVSETRARFQLEHYSISISPRRVRCPFAMPTTVMSSNHILI